MNAILASFLHALWCVKVSISFIMEGCFLEAVNVDALGSDQSKYVAVLGPWGLKLKLGSPEPTQSAE